MGQFKNVKALTFDLFGTVLDLGGSLTPHIKELLAAKKSDVKPEEFWARWRNRQRIEQYQDALMMIGHSGYLETARRALVWTLEYFKVNAKKDEAAEFMKKWQELSPFDDVIGGLNKLKEQYKLVALSNGEPHFLDHLVKNRIKYDFDEIISVEMVGTFKPHPAVYRGAAHKLGLELNECMMISSNSFDIVGAKTCGFQAGFVDRYKFPFEDTSFLPDVTVSDFNELASALI